MKINKKQYSTNNFLNKKDLPLKPECKIDIDTAKFEDTGSVEIDSPEEFKFES